VIKGLWPSIYLNLLLALGAGYVIGEVTSISVNRKRGPLLATIGGAGVFLSYVISILSPWGFSFHLFDLARRSVLSLTSPAIKIIDMVVTWCRKEPG
jgi:hypothetical protein